MGETALASLLCAFLGGGETEVSYSFDANRNRPISGIESYVRDPSVRVDCETATHVIEIGLDGTRSARDSIHQAVFYSLLTGKEPLVNMIDRDGFVDRYEYEIRSVAGRLGVPYASCSKSFILRLAATSPWRNLGLDKNLEDLPQEASVRFWCDLPGDIPVSSF